MDRRSFLKAGGAGLGGLVLAGGVVSLAGRSGSAQLPGVAALDGATMGTSYSVRVAGSMPAEVEPAVRRALADVEARFSTWRPDSELSRFNDSLDSDWQPASREMLRVASTALEHSRSTDGAFDASVGPLVDLWGFGPGAVADGARAPRPARSDEIGALLEHVGAQRLDIDTVRGAWRKQDVALRLDFSGIAKGDAVDRVAAVLEAHGLEHWLVEVGGEIRTRGEKLDGGDWRVGIERPELARRLPFRVVAPQGLAVATSGDYRNFFDHAGQRYSHAIDPRDGRPVSHALASVSVAAPTAVAADALSTGLMILGPDRAMDFAESRRLPVHLLLRSGDAIEERWSSAFEPLIAA